MRRRNKLLALLLVLVLALSGCARPHRNLLDYIAPDGTLYPAADPERGTISYAQMVDNYKRPDLDEMERVARRLMDKVNGMRGGAALKALMEYENLLYDYYTGYTLTSIRYSIDRSDAQAQEEYDFYIDSAQQVQDLSDELYTVVAEGPNTAVLEDNYYGEGYFDAYRQDTGKNSRISALKAQEARLVARYDDLCIGQTIEFEGEERSWDELYADPDIIGRRWQQACSAYYAKYSPLVGEIYLELLQVRRELAELNGWDSYAEYAFDGFGREYTPRQSQDYIQDVITWLLPVYQAAEDASLWRKYGMSMAMTEEEVRGVLAEVLEKMDDELLKIWLFMDKYGLSSLTGSPTKTSGAYETYINYYEAPFLVTNLGGTLGDILTVSHEFGHFCDDYINWGVTYNMDVAECCSQGLEYLLLGYLEGVCSERQVEQLLGGKLLDTLDLYVWQGLYSEFENQVYQLNPDGLTVEDINEVYARVCRTFGMEDDGGAGSYSMGWIEIPHFFEQPFYIISYPVSNDVAMQLWTMEQEKEGTGLKAYMALLDRSDSYAGLMDVIDEVGLDSPFASGRLEAVARAVAAALELDVPDKAA